MTFRENLPPSCPPDQTTIPDQTTLWRLLRSATPTVEDFDSQYKRQPQRRFPDPCTARSVSLITTLEACRAIAKSPRMKGFTHVAGVGLDAASGVWDQDKPCHVNWWPLATVDPLARILAVEEIDHG